MTSLIDPAVLGRREHWRRQFAEARPFRHVVIDSFLEPRFCQALIEQFPAFDRAKATNEMGEVGRKAVRPDLPAIGPAYAKFDAMLQSPEFLTFTGDITGIPSLLYDPAYLGGGTHENLNGQDLDTHVDFNYHPATRLHRRLNLIVFLNPAWQPEWGGVLELQQDPTLPPARNLIQTVVPVENRCVLFETTETSWHGFRRITLPAQQEHRSRRSIAVYFYTKERARAESAPAHGTIYMPRPVPDFVQPGHALTEEEVRELRDQFTRRDDQLKFLYQRELEYSRIAQSPAFRIARGLTWPLRKLRDAL